MKDTVAARYMRQNEVFADAFNFLLYHGRQVIAPDNLTELDTREIEVPYGGKDGAKQPIQRTRDVMKSVTAMTDWQRAYMILAAENQSSVNLAMPVKNLVYDALQYTRQVELAVESHKRSGDYKGADDEEFLSGFMRSDRLLPVVTLVILFNSQEWDGPVTLHEMFDCQDQNVLAFVPDYKINLIVPSALNEEELGRFHSTLREVLSFIKYSDSAEKLEAMANSEMGNHTLGRKEIDVLNYCIGVDFKMEGNGERVTMCKAAQQLEERGRLKMLVANVKSLMRTMGWTAEHAMDALDISDSDRQTVSSQL
ncbi:MAG: hypothetical protein LUE16_07865 [Lachnospiraceae bacterium]|nr:hypothetical protein [Lachnospiraceae bacterium]